MKVQLSNVDLYNIHLALHNPICEEVNIQDIVLPITLHNNGCRHIKLNQYSMIMVQNPNKISKYAERARRGERLSWYIREGKWVLITDYSIIT